MSHSGAAFVGNQNKKFPELHIYFLAYSGQDYVCMCHFSISLGILLDSIDFIMDYI